MLWIRCTMLEIIDFSGFTGTLVIVFLIGLQVIYHHLELVSLTIESFLERGRFVGGGEAI